LRRRNLNNGRSLDGLHFRRPLVNLDCAVVVLAVTLGRAIAITHRLDAETNAKLVGYILVDRT